jgi:glycosyltransferase involved in cell wall biosynthesis
LTATTVHLTNAYHPSSGGIRTFYHALLEGANREQRRVVLIVPGERTETLEIGRFGRIYVLAAPPAPAFDRRYRMLLPHRYFPGTRLVEILVREQPDLVEICDKYSLPYLAAMLRKAWHPRVRRPALVGLTCERLDDNLAAFLSGHRVGRAYARWYMRNIYGPPFDAHIAISAYTADELHDALPDRPAGFIRVCAMGVNVDRFGPHHQDAALRAALLARAGGTPESVLLFYAGRLSPEKNVGLLVSTLHELASSGREDFRLAIAGDGPLAGWLRAKASDMGHRILLLGNLDAGALAAHYASCDVFVHPNPREPFGIGPLEAMASGVPVVVPAVGGVLEYATDANTWRAEPRATAFAAAVRAAAHGDPRRLAAAHATARQFRWEDATRRYFALYDELTALSPGRQTRPLPSRACPDPSVSPSHLRSS